MSDRPIQVGDMVCVVRVCCSEYVEMDWIYTVREIYKEPREARCSFCNRKVPAGMYAAEDSEEVGVPIGWLKRIPPNEELEGVKEADKVPA